MATIQNDRDVLLQAAAIRVVPVTINISDVAGLPEAIARAEKSLEITASAPFFSVAAGGFTTPANITLTVVRKNGLAGAVSWTVESGAATLSPSGGDNNTCTISGPTVAGASVTVRARVNDGGRSYDNRVTIGRYGALSMQNEVDLASQITGQLANGNVSGLGALALLGNVNLGTAQVVGDLAASRIGVGTLAAGVIYAGTVNADKVNAGSFAGKDFTGGTFTGALFRTSVSGRRVEMISDGTRAHEFELTDSDGTVTGTLSAKKTDGHKLKSTSIGPTLRLTQFSSSGIGLDVGSNGGGVNIDSAQTCLTLNVNGASGHQAHMFLNPLGGFPSSASPGMLLMHNTYGLCLFNGSTWVKMVMEAL